MNQFPIVKIELFIPEGYVEALRDAFGKIDVGHIGNYDHCLSVTPVRGYWRPLAGADPFDGEIGKISEGAESKVEVNCPWEKVEDVLRTIRNVHPYEEPVINVVPLLNHLFSQHK